MSEKPRAYTAEEARSQYLGHIRNMVRYWASLPEVDKVTGERRSVKDRLDGLAFSILVMIDGESNLPSLDLTLSPHHSDKDYFISEGENWFEFGQVINDCMLHEIFSAPDIEE